MWDEYINKANEGHDKKTPVRKQQEKYWLLLNWHLRNAQEVTGRPVDVWVHAISMCSGGIRGRSRLAKGKK